METLFCCCCCVDSSTLHLRWNSDCEVKELTFTFNLWVCQWRNRSHFCIKRQSQSVDEDVSYVTILSVLEASSSHVTPLKVWAQRHFPFHEQMKEMNEKPSSVNFCTCIILSNETQISKSASRMSILCEYDTLKGATHVCREEKEVGVDRWVNNCFQLFCF